MVFQQSTEIVPSTRQLSISNTNITTADERANIVYKNGFPTHLILRSTQDKDLMISTEIEPMMVIGRKASIRDYDVTIDLTDLNGAEAGVSRYHVMVLALDNHVHMKDIDSLNGSLLNGKRMTPSKEYIIDDGDIIALGNLELHVEFGYD